MIGKLNGYFVPLYVDNATAAEILRKAGRTPYETKEEWQLVQTHLLQPSGELVELWKPGATTGARDPENLAKALEAAIRELHLDPKPPLPRQDLRAPHPGEALVLDAVMRLDLPPDGDYLGRPSLLVDRIGLTAEEVASLLPPGTSAYHVPQATAARLLAHLRPPRDTAQDPLEEALQRVHAVSLHGTPVQDGVVALQGALRMEAPPSAARRPDDLIWSEILQVDLELEGFLAYDPATRQLQDLQLVTTRAGFVPPNGKTVTYRGMIRPR